MIPLLILFCIIAFALNAVFTRAFQLKFPDKTGTLRLYQALFCLTATIAFGVSHFISNPGFKISFPEMVFGVLFGIFFYIAVVGSAAGYELGSMALTSIIMNMSLFIPLIYSCISDGKLPSIIQFIGIALIAITMILIVDKSQSKTSVGIKWFAVVLAAFFGNGITAVIQKAYITTTTDAKTMIFMAIAYLTATLLLLANALFTAKKANEKLTNGLALTLSIGTVSGLGSFAGQTLLGYLCTRVAGAVLYPCVNGGLCILSALCAFVIFKERPTVRKLSAIAIGASAIVLLSL